MNKGEKSTQRYCRNCHYPIPTIATYCPNCSQKYTTGRVSIGQLLKQLVSNLFNLDSKLFMTLGSLFIPARLTINYFKGQHQRYASPFRVFLVTTLLSLTIISLFISRQDLGLDVSPFSEEIKTAERKAYIHEMDTISEEIRQEFPEVVVSQALDSLHKKMAVDKAGSSAPYFNTVRFSSFLKDSIEEIRLVPSDLNLSIDEIYEKYEVTDLIDQIAVRQIVKFIKSEGMSSFIQYLIGNTIWLMLLFLPSMALLLQLLYIRQSYYYVEHLVFLLHYHSFGFMLIGLFFGLQIFVPNNPLYLIIPVLVYLYAALYKRYQQGWFKTLVKYWIFILVYLILYIVFFSIISIISFFLF